MLARYEIDPGPPAVLTAYGATLGELFENAAFALFDWRGDTDPPRIDRDVPLVAVGDTVEELLGDWLQVAVARARELQLVLVTFTVDRLEMGGVQGVAAGYWAVPGGVSAPQERPVVTEIPDGFWARFVIPGTS